MKRIQLSDTFLDFWGKMRNSSFPWIGLNTHKSDLQKLNAVKSTLLSHFRNRITIGVFGYKFANTRGQWREKYLFDTREGQKRLQRSTPMQVCGSELSCDCNKVQTLERERERERTRENEERKELLAPKVKGKCLHQRRLIHLPSSLERVASVKEVA